MESTILSFALVAAFERAKTLEGVTDGVQNPQFYISFGFDQAKTLEGVTDGKQNPQFYINFGFRARQNPDRCH